MSKHVSEWLSAYHDGELRGSRLHQVEEHLLDCDTCRVELEALESLSGLLHEVPAATFMPPERMASQVALRLPHKQVFTTRKKILEIGWWLIPVGLLATWVFVSTAFLLGNMLTSARNLGLLNNVSGWLVLGSSGNADWSAALGQWGILSGNSLNWAAFTETMTRTALPQMSFHISIALLYLSWMAIGWARRLRRGQSPLIEG